MGLRYKIIKAIKALNIGREENKTIRNLNERRISNLMNLAVENPSMTKYVQCFFAGFPKKIVRFLHKKNTIYNMSNHVHTKQRYITPFTQCELSGG